MAVRIRFTRRGKKNRAFFRIAVFNSKTKRDGPYLENLGTYDPIEKDPSKKVKLNKEQYNYWISKGAKPTQALTRILRHTKVLSEEASKQLS